MCRERYEKEERKRRWMDSIKHDLTETESEKSLRISGEEAQDRAAWKLEFFFFSILCRAAFNAAYSHTEVRAES